MLKRPVNSLHIHSKLIRQKYPLQRAGLFVQVPNLHTRYYYVWTARILLTRIMLTQHPVIDDFPCLLYIALLPLRLNIHATSRS